MDYYQGIVAEYLRANRSVFLNTECFIQIEPGSSPPKGTSWFCDIAAINMKEKTAYLCEVTFSTTLDSLKKRFSAWDMNWGRVREALAQDCAIPLDWKVVPWAFIPEDRIPKLRQGMSYTNMPEPRITALEAVVPWKYDSWNRTIDDMDELTIIQEA